MEQPPSYAIPHLPKTPRSAVAGAGAGAGPLSLSFANLTIGDRVTLPDGQVGLLRYVGPIDGKHGDFAGVELIEEYASMGRHNGEHEGRQYFLTETSQSGLFISFTKLLRSNTGSAGPSAAVTPSRKSMIGRRSSLTPGSAIPPSRSVPRSRQSLIGTSLPPPQPSSVSHHQSARLKSPQGHSPIPPLSRGSGASSSGSFKRPSSSVAPLKLDQAFPSIAPDKRFSSSSSDFGIPEHGPNAYRTTPTFTNDYDSDIASNNNNASVDDNSSVKEHHQQNSNNTSAAIANAVARAVSQVQAEAQREIVELKKQILDRDEQLYKQSDALKELERTVLQDLSDEAARQDAGNGAVDIETSKALHELKEQHQRELEAILEERDRKFTTMKAQFDEKRNEFRKTIDTLQSDLQESNSVYVNEIQTLQIKLSDAERVTMRVNELEQIVQDLEVSATATAANTISPSIEEQREAKAQLKKLADAENKLLENEGRLTDLMGQLEDSRNKISMLESAAVSVSNGSASNSPARRRSLPASADLEELKRELDDLKIDNEGLSLKLEQAEIEKEIAVSEASIIRQDLERLQRERDELALKLEQSQIEHELATSEATMFKDELQQERKLRLQAEQELSNLEGLLEDRIFKENSTPTPSPPPQRGGANSYHSLKSSPAKSPLLKKHHSPNQGTHTPSNSSSIANSPSTPALDALLDELPVHSPGTVLPAASFSHVSIPPAASTKSSSSARSSLTHTSPPPSIPLPPTTAGGPAPKILSPVPSIGLPMPGISNNIGSPVMTGIGHPHPGANIFSPTRPKAAIDLADGRDKWCGLCERDGHDSLNCPYEMNDDDFAF